LRAQHGPRGLNGVSLDHAFARIALRIERFKLVGGHDDFFNRALGLNL
jgi:hypothetical protein